VSGERRPRGDEVPHARRAWLFQANPNRYRIHESLEAEREEFWNLNQHVADVHAGDRVLIWVCGKEAGIYAIGTIVGEPEVRPDSAAGLGYWLQSAEGRQPKARVRVRYDRVLLDRPLRKAYLECDPVLARLKVLQVARGTNFPVSDEEWCALAGWLAGPWAAGGD